MLGFAALSSNLRGGVLPAYRERSAPVILERGENATRVNLRIDTTPIHAAESHLGNFINPIFERTDHATYG